jgi:predicted metal-dependent hydrolase
VNEPTIIRSNRSSITIQVTPKGEVIVKAPRFMPVFLIKQFIKSKQEWIDKHLEKMGGRRSVPKKFVEGEEFLYLGNMYMLHVGSYKEINAVDGVFQFPDFLSFRAEKEIHNWYIQKAKERIPERLEYHADQMDTHYTRVFFSDTISKWGTCWPDNSLQFNWRLIMAPIVVLDYVVIHELAHTIEKNHSNEFWKIVGKYTPAFKTHRKWLHNHAHLLHF